MAKKEVFERTNKIQDYLAQLEELLKKNKGTGLYEAYNVNPRAFRLPGRVYDPSGLGQDRMNDPVKFAPYDYSTIPFDAPNVNQVPEYQFQGAQLPEFPMPEFPMEDESIYSAPPSVPEAGMSAQEFIQELNQVLSVPVSQSKDGGIIYSDGSVRYADGTTRQVDISELPRPLFQLSNGAIMFKDGVARKMTYTLGRAFQGVSGLSDLLFGRQQDVTQPYGNYNTEFGYANDTHAGTDFRTRDLPTSFNFALPFDTKVLAKTADDGTRFGTISGHGGYGNSIYLQLPNGMILHLSHLSDMINVQPGQIISAFDYIGTPGSSGNSQGEHLDLEFLDQNLTPISPDEFFLDAQSLINYDEIEKAQTVSDEELAKLPPEEKQLVDVFKLSAGSEWKPAPPVEQVTEQQPILPLVGQAIAQDINTANLTGDFDFGISEMFAGDPEAAKLAREQTIQKYSPIEAELGLSEGLFTPEAERARIEALNRQPKVYNPYRQLIGNVTERVGDVLGIREGAFSEGIAGGATKRTNQALASEIGGETPEQVPGIRQNIRDIGEDLNKRVVQPVVAKAGEGIDFLKEKASNIFQKTPLMGLFGGQKQVGDAKGATLFEGGQTQSHAPQADAFFKYGGADQYADYLVNNAREKQGGALSTSLFTPEFYQDPNRVANVFGETSQGRQATSQYKDYLQSQIKPGFDEPFKTERRQEGDMIYEYKIPIQEYFQNQYYKDLMSNTPDVLKTGFSYDQFQMPQVSKSASEYKGDVPVKTSSSPIFKSGVVDLFKRSSQKLGQLAQPFMNEPAPVYQSSIRSGSYNIPEASQSVFQMPTAESLQIPQTSKTFISKVEPPKPRVKPSLQDYLNQGKSVAQWFAEVEGQDKLDALQKKGYDPRSNKIPDEYKNIQRTISDTNKIASSVSPEVAQRISEGMSKQRAEEEAAIKSGVGLKSVAPSVQSQPSAQLSSSVKPGTSIFSSVSDWVKRLFKRK